MELSWYTCDSVRSFCKPRSSQPLIQLYQHRDLGTLADVFATLRAHAVKSSLLTADTVLVSNRGAARWLQARLTEGCGSAANL